MAIDRDWLLNPTNISRMRSVIDDIGNEPDIPREMKNVLVDIENNLRQFERVLSRMGYER